MHMGCDDLSTLMVMKKCTVRQAISTNSHEVRVLAAGATVQVLERGVFEGHQRVRIGENEWASQVTAKGSVLMALSSHAADDFVKTGNPLMAEENEGE